MELAARGWIVRSRASFGIHNGMAIGSIYAAGLGGAEAEVAAAADGPPRKDRLLRP